MEKYITKYNNYDTTGAVVEELWKNKIESLRQEENALFRERIRYLERSNNRREDEILELRDELNTYASLVEHLKTLSLYDCQLDYDYDDNSFLDYIPFDMEYYINNYFEVMKIDEEEELREET